MTEFLQSIAIYPTVIFSALLALVLIYWTFVIVGVVELKDGGDGMDLEGGDGDLDLDGKGSILGGKDASVEADADVDCDADGHVHADGHDGGHGHGDGDGDGDAGKGGFVSLLKGVGLAGVPITVSFSFLILYAWVAAMFGTPYALKLGLAGVAAALFLTAFAFLAVMVALPVAVLSIKPLRPLFEVKQARSRRSLVGLTCTIKSGSVGTASGRAEVDDGEAGLLIDVGCPKPNALARESKALIYDYDAQDERFLVCEPDQK